MLIVANVTYHELGFRQTLGTEQRQDVFEELNKVEELLEPAPEVVYTLHHTVCPFDGRSVQELSTET
jgi:hypothetical protein